MHFDRGNLQAADGQGLPLNDSRKGGENGKGTRRCNRRKQRKQSKGMIVKGIKIEKVAIAWGRSAGL